VKVFALTFAFNEHTLLPRWARYYASQVGLGPVNIIQVPRTPFDDVRKAHVPILQQRHPAPFDSWMCKRRFGRRPIRFGRNCRTSDQPVRFDTDRSLIQLKNFDFGFRRNRQQATAGWEHAGNIAGLRQPDIRRF
jgi:hypothetical protein